MPINPAIALGVKPVEIANPLAMYSQVAQIQNYQQQNALNQMKMEEARREETARNALSQAYQSAYDPTTGEINVNRLTGALATGGYGAQIPGVQKEFRLAEEAKLKGQTQRQALIKSKLDNVKPLYQQALASADPGAAMMEIHRAVHFDPDLGAWLKSMGATPERGEQDIMAAIAQGPEAVKQKILSSIAAVDKLLPTLGTVETGGGTQMITRDPITGETTLGSVVPKTPLPKDVEAQKARIATAGASKTVIDLGKEKQYGETVAKGGGEEDLAMYKFAQSAPEQIRKVDETLGILKTQDINTGLGADLFTVLDRAKTLVNDAKAKNRVINTEFLDTLLGSEVFPQISALGIGARGLDTPAEREFLRKVITGNISLDKGTLVKMAEFRRKAIETEVNKFNKLVDSGELDDFFKSRRRTKAKVELPQATTGSAPAGVPQNVWDVMTPGEKALWQK